MKAICLFFLLILLFSVTDQTTAQRDVCPPWFILDNTSSTGCSCHHSYAGVKCSSDFPLLQFGYCMTYNATTDTTEYGPCPYITRYNNTTVVDYAFYIQLPGNVSLLNGIPSSLFLEQPLLVGNWKLLQRSCLEYNSVTTTCALLCIWGMYSHSQASHHKAWVAVFSLKG